MLQVIGNFCLQVSVSVRSEMGDKTRRSCVDADYVEDSDMVEGKRASSDMVLCLCARGRKGIGGGWDLG